MSARNIELTMNADAAIGKNLVVKLVSPGAASYEPGSGYVEVSAAAGTGHIPFGIAQEAATAADDAIRVVTYGEAYGEAGGTFAPGDPVKAAADGQLVAASGASQYIVGFALQDGADGKVCKIFVNPGFWTFA